MRLFKSGVTLTTFPGQEEKGDLYEWAAGQLQLVSVLPGAEARAPGDPQLGNSVEKVNSDDQHAISNNGSRVFWTLKEQGPGKNISTCATRPRA